MKTFKSKWTFLLALPLIAPFLLSSPVSAAVVSTVALIGIVEPIPGKNPVYMANPADSSLYQVNTIEWHKCTHSMGGCGEVMLSTETFVAGQYYLPLIDFYTMPGNTFSTPLSTTINGRPAVNEGGTTSASASVILLAEHTYGFNITPSDNYTFPSKTVGYSAVDEYTFAVESFSTEAIKVSANISGSVSAFDIKTTLPGSPIQDIELGTGGGKVTFRIIPKIGLAAGTYDIKITITGTNSPNKALSISFTVNPTTSPETTAPKSDTDDSDLAQPEDEIDPSVLLRGVNQSSLTPISATGASLDEADTAENSEFNWLWIPFAALLATAIGTGIAFFIIRKNANTPLRLPPTPPTI